MYRLICDNQRGEQLDLTSGMSYVITNIDGLAMPNASINMLERAGHDGSKFNSAKVEPRQIIIDLAINSPVCENRNRLYDFFRSGRAIRLYYYNDLRNVYIDAYVQNAPVSFFIKKEVTQITLICPDPFWHGIVEIQGRMDGIDALFEFPFSIEQPIAFSESLMLRPAILYNPGNYESGIIAEIRASGAATNPKIYHQNTDMFFQVNTTLQSGDVLIIDTKTDAKSISRIRGGSTTNLIASRDASSTWLTAEPGRNMYTLLASSGRNNLDCTIQFKSNLGGV